MKNQQETLFLTALEQHQEKLFRICSIYAKDDDDAKDLFQEILVHVWKAMGTFKGDAAISTWMYRIALNVCLRFKSKHTKNQHRFIRLDSIVIANYDSVDYREDKNEKLHKLRICVKTLNEADKAIVALYLEGLAYREISTILGLSENHIAVKVKRIKSKLLNCINENS
ncbi:RNA polymerase sigma factor [Maribacter chungangensis]|uniref:RNA polymerase sigma factor n=1 Tax=Maribacter chungangensis TaxID=1069117 RepID=A0ABW3B935_9FLAO